MEIFLQIIQILVLGLIFVTLQGILEVLGITARTLVKLVEKVPRGNY